MSVEKISEDRNKTENREKDGMKYFSQTAFKKVPWSKVPIQVKKNVKDAFDNKTEILKCTDKQQRKNIEFFLNGYSNVLRSIRDVYNNRMDTLGNFLSGVIAYLDKEDPDKKEIKTASILRKELDKERRR